MRPRIPAPVRPTALEATLTFRKLHRNFVAEGSPIELRNVHNGETLAEIRRGMDESAVLVFRDQPFSDAE